MKCCICGKEIKGIGNNPSPLKDLTGEYFGAEDRCCNECDDAYVIPMRLAQLTQDEDGMKLIQNQIDRLQGKLVPHSHIIATIERPDGSTFEQEIFNTGDIKESLKRAQKKLGNPYYTKKYPSGRKELRIRSTAYLIVGYRVVEVK